MLPAYWGFVRAFLYLYLLSKIQFCFRRCITSELREDKEELERSIAKLSWEEGAERDMKRRRCLMRKMIIVNERQRVLLNFEQEQVKADDELVEFIETIYYRLVEDEFMAHVFEATQPEHYIDEVRCRG